MTAIYIFVIIFLAYVKTRVQSAVNNCDSKDSTCIIRSFGYSPSCVLDAISNCADLPLPQTVDNEIKKASRSLERWLKTGQSPLRPSNCDDLMAIGDTSGPRTIYPYVLQPGRPAKVFCDQDSDGGGWTVILRRKFLREREDFERSWFEYRVGFGSANGEFFSGLDSLHSLTNNLLMKVRINFQTWEKRRFYATYNVFHVGDPDSYYKLTLSGYSDGTAGDGFESGGQFKTFDRASPNDTCTELPLGGWWNSGCSKTNLNGPAPKESQSVSNNKIKYGLYMLGRNSIMSAEMKIRPVFNSFSGSSSVPTAIG